MTHRDAMWLQRVACAFLVGEWALILCGLRATPDAHVWDDLEAGGRFALTIDTAVPFFFVTLYCGTLVLVGLVSRFGAVCLIAAAPIGFLFAWYLAGSTSAAVLPELQPQAQTAMALAAVALVLGVVAEIAHHRAERHELTWATEESGATSSGPDRFER
jgi:hypothetical protein